MSSMHHAHHLFFVGLSLAVAVLGSWTALDLFRRVQSHIGRTQRIWLGAAAVAMGLSIWSMHFIAMLGFDPGSPVSYDLGLTVLSLALAIIATLGAFMAASQPRPSHKRLLLAGTAMGAGICLMHYVGMAALRTAASLGYAPVYVAASFVIAVLAATAALIAAQRERTLAWRASAAITLGFAIVGMHYTAMAGLRLTPLPSAAMGVAGVSPFALGLSVAAGTVVILLLALIASLYDQRLNILFALEAGGVGYWEFSLPDRTLHVSRGVKILFGHDPDGPFTEADLLAALAPEERMRRNLLNAQALASDKDYDAEYRLSDAHGGRWINVRGRVTSRVGGAPRRMTGVMLDVTDRRNAFAALAHAQEHQKLLIAELNHRVKNTLATVQSVARQSVKGAKSVEEFREAFDARLVALSHTHNALTRGGWTSASLRELLTGELAPYAPGQIELQGPDVALEARQALALGMVFHELATNAAKYGALSTPDGCVAVAWSAGGGRLEIRWRERGGPPVRPPARRGFGSRLVEGSVTGELGGHAELSFGADGFSCRLDVPWRPAEAPAPVEA
jgi:NO-binding membrane sensor protein with MHYT domain/two-component sensor histidine kinase